MPGPHAPSQAKWEVLPAAREDVDAEELADEVENEVMALQA